MHNKYAHRRMHRFSRLAHLRILQLRGKGLRERKQPPLPLCLRQRHEAGRGLVGDAAGLVPTLQAGGQRFGQFQQRVRHLSCNMRIHRQLT